MQVHGRNFGASRSNHLKSHKELPQVRFSDLERAESLARLERLSDVRSAVVMRGKSLIANRHYPDNKILRKMSQLLAAQLRF